VSVLERGKTVRLPPDTDARLGFVPGQAGAYFVFLAAPPETAGMHLLDLLTRPGSLTAMLTHDPGVSWPDRRGVDLAEAMLAGGGVAILQFATMADALACHGRLMREGVR
jgi:hypothetical protein